MRLNQIADYSFPFTQNDVWVRVGHSPTSGGATLEKPSIHAFDQKVVKN